MLEDANWKTYRTKPIPVRVLELGEDIYIEGIPDAEPGDFLLENPDPIDRQMNPLFHVPRAEFLAHYEPLIDEENEDGTAEAPVSTGDGPGSA